MGKVLKGNERHQFNLPSDWLSPAVPLVPAQLDCCAGGSQGCPLRSRRRTKNKYIINAQLPFVAGGSVLRSEPWGFGSLLSSVSGVGEVGTVPVWWHQIPAVLSALCSVLFFWRGVRTNGYFQIHP